MRRRTRPTPTANTITRRVAWFRLMRPGATLDDVPAAIVRALRELGDAHPLRLAVTTLTGTDSPTVDTWVSITSDQEAASAALSTLQEALGWFSLGTADCSAALHEHRERLPEQLALVPHPADGSLLLPRGPAAVQPLPALLAHLARQGTPTMVQVEASTVGRDEALAVVPALRTARAVADALAPHRLDVASPQDLLAPPMALRGADPERLLADVVGNLWRVRVAVRSARPLPERVTTAIRLALEEGGVRLAQEATSPATGAGIVHTTVLPAVWQVPVVTAPCGHLRVEDLPRLPAPVGALDKGFLLGETDDGPRTRELRLDPEVLGRHAYVVGKTGTGKTTLLESLVASAIERGDQAVIVVDPHGDMTEKLLRWLPREHADRALAIDFGDPERLPSLNLLEARDEQEREFAIGELDALFLDMYGPEIWGPRLQDTFRNLASLLSIDPEGPGTLVDLLWAANLRHDPIRHRLEAIAESSGSISHRIFLEQIQQRQYGDGSLQELVAYYRSKFSPFVDNKTLRLVLGRPKSTLDIARFIRERRVCLFNLNKGRISSRYASLIGRILTARIFQAALANGRLPPAERPPALLVLDEFQNLVSPTVEDILAEARKYRLSVVLANQHLAQVRRSRTDVRGDRSSMLDAILGNVGTLVAFRLSGLDATQLAAELGGHVPAETLSSLPAWHAVCQVSESHRCVPPFLARTRPIGACGDPSVARSVRSRSRRTLCTRLDDAERAIRQRVLSRMGIVDVPDDPVGHLLERL